MPSADSQPGRERVSINRRSPVSALFSRDFPWVGLFAGISAAGFIWLASRWIDLPGLYFDECRFVATAYPDPTKGGTGYVFGDSISLMIASYTGALKGWIYRGLAEVFGGSPATARLPMIVLGGVTILCLASLARRAFGGVTAAAAAFLTASDPTFLFTTRLDWGPGTIQRLCLVAGCLLVLRWHQQRRTADLMAGFFVFGLGVFDKAIFIWTLAALGVSGLLVFRRRCWVEIRWKTLSVATLSLVVGAAPYLWYQLTTHDSGLELRLETDPDRYRGKLAMLNSSLAGVSVQGWVLRSPREDRSDQKLGTQHAPGPDVDGRRLQATWLWPALVTALLALPLTLLGPYRRGLLFLLLFCLSFWAVNFIVHSAGSVHHLTLVYPFPQLFLAASLGAVLERVKQQRLRVAAGAAVVAVLVALVAVNLRTVGQSYARMLRYGGIYFWSEAIYPLAEHLRSQRPREVVALEWGIGNQLRLLFNDEVAVEGMPFEGRTAGERILAEKLEQPGTAFVAYEAPRSPELPPYREWFSETADRLGFQTEITHTVADRQGRPVYVVISATRDSAEPLPD